MLLLVAACSAPRARLASAYGIAVADHRWWSMAILGFIVIWKLWKWKPWPAALLIMPLVVHRRHLPCRQYARSSFEGAWVPLLFGAV